MLAFDDGTNTYYGSSNETQLSFPILQSGPLDRIGSAKGGPFTEGCHACRYERNRQYSTMTFIPADNITNTEPCLEIHAYRMVGRPSKETVFTKRLCGKVFRPSHRDVRVGTCQLDDYSPNSHRILWMIALLVCVGKLLVANRILVLGAGVGLATVFATLDIHVPVLQRQAVAVVGIVVLAGTILLRMVKWMSGRRASRKAALDDPKMMDKPSSTRTRILTVDVESNDSGSVIFGDSREDDW